MRAWASSITRPDIQKHALLHFRDKGFSFFYLKYALVTFNTSTIKESKSSNKKEVVSESVFHLPFWQLKKTAEKGGFGVGEREERKVVGSSPPIRCKIPMDFTPAHK